MDGILTFAAITSIRQLIRFWQILKFPLCTESLKRKIKQMNLNDQCSLAYHLVFQQNMNRISILCFCSYIITSKSQNEWMSWKNWIRFLCLNEYSAVLLIKSYENFPPWIDEKNFHQRIIRAHPLYSKAFMVSAVINGDLHPFERYWVKHIFHELLKILCEKVFRKTLVFLIDSWLLCAFSLLLSIPAFFSNWIIPWIASHERRRENLQFFSSSIRVKVVKLWKWLNL